MNKSRVVLGMDLGLATLKTYYAYVDGDATRSGVVPLDGADSFPSVAFYNETEDEWVFGEKALNGACDSQKPIVRIKDILNAFNKDTADRRDFENKACGYTFRAKTDTWNSLLKKFFTRTLGELLPKALEWLGLPYDTDGQALCFAYPSSASNEYKIALKNILSELNFTSIAIAEPFAAATCCLDEAITFNEETMLIDIGETDSTVVVFDEGINGEAIKFGKVANIGVGGNDFDDKIVDYVVKHCGIEEELSYFQQFLLSEDVKKAKERLCDGARYAIVRYQSDVIVNVKITPESFAQATKAVTEEFLRQLLNILKQNTGVFQIVLTGGGSKNIFLTEAIYEFGKQHRIEVNEFANGLYGVAKGAALKATNRYNFAGISTKSYGAVCNSSVNKLMRGVKTVIPKNSRLPITVEMDDFCTSRANQKHAEIKVCCSDCDGTEKVCSSYYRNYGVLPLEVCTVLSEGLLNLKGRLAEGTTIIIRITIDAEGIGHVNAYTPGGYGTYESDFDTIK